jgi:hypothetical protein
MREEKHSRKLEFFWVVAMIDSFGLELRGKPERIRKKSTGKKRQMCLFCCLKSLEFELASIKDAFR